MRKRFNKTMRNLVVMLVAAAPLAAVAASPQTSVLDIQNMTCPACTITIRKAIERVPGVISVQVDYDRKTAVVRYDPEKASASDLVKSTANAGFPSTVHEEGRR